MSETQIQVTFDPAGTEKTRFAFSPVRSFIDNKTSAVLFQLSTKGGNGRAARFVAPEGSRWTGPFAEGEALEQGPVIDGLTQIADADHTVLEVRGLPINETDQQEVFEYVVTVDYDGKTYSSRPGYPSTTCVPTGGSGG